MVKMSPFKQIDILGGGAWGTVLARLLAKAGYGPRLWCLEKEVAEDINKNHRNSRWLAGVELPEEITATNELRAEGDVLFVAIPARHLEGVLADLPKGLTIPIVLCAKGLAANGDLLHQRIRSIQPAARLAALGGPTFAVDLAADKPGAAVIAAEDEHLGLALANMFASSGLRAYGSDDITGVAVGGVVKNIIAIAAGAAIGHGLGESAASSLIARGYAEMQRLGASLGAQASTMAGLAGLGDLCLTATSALSRNFQLGVSLGRGEKPSQNKTAEGAWSAPIMVKKAAALGVEMPIGESVASLLGGETTVTGAVDALMSRPLKNE